MRSLNFDIDGYLNPYVPRNRLGRLPEPVARFFGIRKSPIKEVGNVLVWCWSFLGAFCGLSLVAGVLKTSPVIQRHHPPVLFASLGATAILDYNAIQSPLAQPRAVILGQVVPAIIGVAITKLFRLSSDFEQLRWLAAALSCGSSSFVMGFINSIHPPGGATAVLAAVDPEVTELGWYFVPLIFLGSVLMLLVALIINNIQRQYPVFWWTPRDVGRQTKSDIETASDGSVTTQSEQLAVKVQSGSHHPILTISPDHVTMPHGFVLGEEEKGVLEVLRDRLRELSSESGREHPDRSHSTARTFVDPNAPEVLEKPQSNGSISSSSSR